MTCRYCNNASECGLRRSNGIVDHPNIFGLLTRVLGQDHLDIHLLLTASDTTDEMVSSFGRLHAVQECANRLDGRAVEREQDVPYRESGSCCRAVWNDLAD